MSPEPHKPDDQALEDFLAGRDEVSRAWREESGESAPAHLDRLVLEQAQQAVSAQRSRKQWRWASA
jgi:hypothetical protein